jgi:hypothetical protein
MKAQISSINSYNIHWLYCNGTRFGPSADIQPGAGGSYREIAADYLIPPGDTGDGQSKAAGTAGGT